jgi:hypothetical protein
MTLKTATNECLVFSQRAMTVDEALAALTVIALEIGGDAILTMETWPISKFEVVEVEGLAMVEVFADHSIPQQGWKETIQYNEQETIANLGGKQSDTPDNSSNGS